MKQQMLTQVPEQQKAILQNMSLMEIIKQMPKEQLDKMLKQSNQKIRWICPKEKYIGTSSNTKR